VALLLLDALSGQRHLSAIEGDMNAAPAKKPRHSRRGSVPRQFPCSLTLTGKRDVDVTLTPTDYLCSLTPRRSRRSVSARLAHRLAVDCLLFGLSGTSNWSDHVRCKLTVYDLRRVESPAHPGWALLICSACSPPNRRRRVLRRPSIKVHS
jgi:hypothetical protein